MMMMMNATQRSSPFTASQWQELEHQALIFKYIMSGMPLPSDLLYSLRKGLNPISNPSSTLFPLHPYGWGCFQVGFGRKVDPEPGRCRRTDGKKWRCSKEAFPDSKYCEKHMHRGRNRSRKPVETNTSAATSTVSTTTLFSAKPSDLSSRKLNPLSPLSSRSPGFNFLQQNTAHHFNMHSLPFTSADSRDYRCLNGLKEGVDEHAFFSEASGTLRGVAVADSFDGSWRRSPLKSSSLAQRQLEVERKEKPRQQPLRPFFDEWPQKSRDPWLTLQEERSNPTALSRTQLSISIPMASSDFTDVTLRSPHGD